jgi:WD40 repeat protein
VLTCCGTGAGNGVRISDPDGGVEAVRGPGTPDDVAVAPDGRVVVARTVRRDVVVTGGSRRLTVPGGGFGQLSSDGRWVTAATDAGVDIWSVDRGRRSASIDGVFSLAFSPTGPLVAVATETGPIRLIDRTTGSVRGTLGGDIAVGAMRFSPDASVLATVTRQIGTGSRDRAAVELWDVRSRRRLGEEPLVERAARFDGARTAFAPDGSKLVVSGLGAPVVFDLDVDAWAARAGRLVAGGP